MKLRDVKIGKLLSVGIGFMVVFLLVIGAIAIYDTNAIWRDINDLYTHPLAVRKAAFNVMLDVAEIRRIMNSLALSGTSTQLPSVAENLAPFDDDAVRQLDIIALYYLGPASDVQKLRSELLKWHAVHDITLRLFREGKTAEGLARISPKGAEEESALVVDRVLSSILTFAQGKLDRYFAQIASDRERFIVTLVILILFLSAASSTIGYLILHGIKDPLLELNEASEKLQKGNMDIRCAYSAGNELGKLSAAFNSLAGYVQSEFAAKELALAISKALLTEDALLPYFETTILALIEKTSAISGAAYLADAKGEQFLRIASIGSSGAGRLAFQIPEKEGQLGLAITGNRISRISGIDKSSFTAVPAVDGDIAPSEIVTIPIFSGKKPRAIFSFSSVKGFSPQALRLFEDVHPTLSARTNGILLFDEIRQISEKLETQNGELEAQKRELTAQKEELTEQNQELEVQSFQLKEADRLKSNFLSNMSHELRTPLNSVIALAGVLRKRLKGAIRDEEYQYLEIISRNGKQLLTLINDILDLSRIESGKEDFDYKFFSLPVLLGEIASTLSPQAAEKGVLLANRTPTDLPTIFSDEEKLRHVLQNVVGNAVKFTDRGSVEIEAEKADGKFVVRVSDTGIGIAADQIPHIFEEFRQADESASRKYGGTGLGLAIAKRYVELLGGSIAVESRLGVGSAFTINMPETPPATGDAPNRTDDTLASSSSWPKTRDTGVSPQRTPEDAASSSNLMDERRKSILLVEDSEPAAIQIKEILEEDGYEMTVLKNGEKAIEILRRRQFDAMILDLMMPGADGFEVLAEARKMSTAESMPVLILTAKHITKEELSFLTGNHIHQLIRKGDVSGPELLKTVADMVKSRTRFDVRQSDTYNGAIEQKTPHPAFPSHGGKPKILVVEDNLDNITTLSAVLGEQYSILSALDAESALRSAESETPDLIIMDISLPGMDGFALLDELRAADRTKRIPVLALTARAMKGDKEDILSHGFNAYVSKPVADDSLEKKISEVLNGR